MLKSDSSPGLRIHLPFSYSQMCARGFGGSDSCTGDSGGPLMARHGSAWHIEGSGDDYFDDVVTCNMLVMPSKYLI